MNEMIVVEQLRDNRAERLPCAVLVDTSGSMYGGPIAEVNEGLKTLEEDLKEDPMARKSVQLCVIRFGGDVELMTDWRDAQEIEMPTLSANGLTPMGQAVHLALDKIEAQKQLYDEHGISRKRAWLFVLSDGAPNDDGWELAAERMRQAIADRRIVPFVVGTADADFQTLSMFTIAGFEPMRVRKGGFGGLFRWLSASSKSASKRHAGERMQMEPKDDWIDL